MGRERRSGWKRYVAESSRRDAGKVKVMTFGDAVGWMVPVLTAAVLFFIVGIVMARTADEVHAIRSEKIKQYREKVAEWEAARPAFDALGASLSVPALKTPSHQPITFKSDNSSEVYPVFHNDARLMTTLYTPLRFTYTGPTDMVNLTWDDVLPIQNFSISPIKTRGLPWELNLKSSRTYYSGSSNACTAKYGAYDPTKGVGHCTEFKRLRAICVVVDYVDGTWVKLHGCIGRNGVAVEYEVVKARIFGVGKLNLDPVSITIRHAKDPYLQGRHLTTYNFHFGESREDRTRFSHTMFITAFVLASLAFLYMGYILFRPLPQPDGNP